MTVAPPIMKSRQHKPKAGHPWTTPSYEQMERRKAAIAAAKLRRETFK